jgi:putative transposase
MVTAGTYGKVRHFSDSERLNVLTSKLMEYANRYDWRLQAWAVMSNHYHFIGFPSDPANLKDFISSLHTETARYVNDLDRTTNRKVWYQYWDSRITYQKSYYARLKYVHGNPVHHGIVPVAENYDWCSAGWFKMNAEPSFRKTVESFKTDTLKVFDDF